MRTIAAGFQTLLDARTGKFAHIVRVTRKDGTVVRLTDAPADVVVSGDGTYVAKPGVVVGDITKGSGGDSDSIDINIPIGGASNPITKAAVIAGYYDHATIEIEVLDYSDPTAGTVPISIAMIGDIQYDDAGQARFDIVGLWGLAIMLRMRTFGPGCGTELGHPTWCKIPVLPDDVARDTAYALGDTARFSDDGTVSGYGNVHFECTTAGTTAATAPTFDYTVGNTTTDGTVVWTARNGWTRHAVIASVINSLAFAVTVTEPKAVDDWFTRGAGKFAEGSAGGNNQNKAFDIRKWTQSTSRVDLWAPMPGTVQVGDALEIHAGCQLTLADCRDKFDNLLHFQGFPHLPDVPFGSYDVNG